MIGVASDVTDSGGTFPNTSNSPCTYVEITACIRSESQVGSDIDSKRSLGCHSTCAEEQKLIMLQSMQAIKELNSSTRNE